MNDAAHMARALALARAVAGKTAPNPAVGCVIVQNGASIGEGATGEGGRPHAEEVALAAAGEAARGAVAYVTLEPCALRSTGAASCAQRLRDAGVARVVIAARDPHPNAAGAGINLLAAAGIDVDVGLMEPEAHAVNADFIAQWTFPPP
ncbi:MAG: riboflavin biosynthesis protein RibD [Alphaproteobacteria bacterium]|nr:riboflavin biosynthesis protein RibD [Alphaproteobacteria bacterium]